MNNYILPFLWMRGEQEEIIREEIEKICECGIRAVCVEARPHDDFCGPGWWHDMDIVIDEAKKRDMKIWILDDKHFPTGYAAGLIASKYPERKKWYLTETTADVFGSVHPYTLNVGRMLKPVIGYWQIGQPVNEEERKNNTPVAVTAVKFTGADTFGSEVIDLTEQCREGKLSFTLPEGQWRVHVVYKTRTDGGNEDYINMLDGVSAHTQIEGVYEAHYEHYKEEFGRTIAGFFSDEPALGNAKEVSFRDKVGKKGLPLPWSDELEEMLVKRWGEEYRKNLTFLFAQADKDSLTAQLRYDFMDCVSRLYEKNFSCWIGDWCRAHGVEYIGHVVEDDGCHCRTGMGTGHWFRAMSGQDMAGIDIIGNQVIFGAPTEIRRGMGGMEINGEFFHYILGKLGASAGHLDPRKKGRTMCELFGAYGWNFGVRDMKYLLDHLLARGINYLVPHAFSMAEYPDIDCPPHFYARGNNGQFPWFAQLMKYANRMCGQLNGGTHKASVALLYDGELDWAGEHMLMQTIGRVLTENQIEFDVVSLDMLKNPSRYNGKLENGELTINGVTFLALVVPYSPYIPFELAQFAENSGEFRICFAKGFPEGVLKDALGRSMKSEAWKKSCEAVELSALPDVLRSLGLAAVTLEKPFPQLTVYHYEKDREIFMLMNENPSEAYNGNIYLPTEEELVCYDGITDTYRNVSAEAAEGDCAVTLNLEPGESCLLMEKKDIAAQGVWEMGETQVLADLSCGWEVELIRPKEYPEAFKTMVMETLAPVSDTEPQFSGVIRYTKEFELAEIPEKAYFRVESVYEVMSLTVNGKKAGVCLTPPYRLDITPYLREGENTITVEAANTPGRDQMNYSMPPFDFTHEALEPSGMFGKVQILSERKE